MRNVGGRRRWTSDPGRLPSALVAARAILGEWMLHNVDTVGADVDASLLGLPIESRRCLTFEVIPRWMEDRGKNRWGHGQEDVYPVCQFEKLWGDRTTLPEVKCDFGIVPGQRDQQLQDQAQLDGWLQDGSAACLEGLCAWE